MIALSLARTAALVGGVAILAALVSGNWWYTR